ncbi:cysteine proteinase [Macrolepiota fuliginosa MF-IS2]|uniref:Cysteine proteinase n=1 Tax=Macrolepiota fuliginosa MF-IS2 TaxID=1400762 RepID=A0A9P5XHM4_9AGAR|nr:cysteine proteinase [Macrolepiota fuliginosa MF-IS2]
MVPSSTYVSKKPNLLQTPELESVIASCKKRVERIAKDCRAGNRKFRDVEFDLENDQHRCIYGLVPKQGETFSPSDVLRTTKIFKNAKFFANGTPDSTQIVQGGIGDCWFLSALSAVATAPGLLEQLCVAHDESVGVYGFIFFRDNRWVDVIIDDQLYTRRPKYEDLTPFEQSLYHDDKECYLKSASVDEGKTLYFARSGTRDETWVPLMEKAYAKLHGHYAYLHLGKTSEALEDLTGGVSKSILTNDILDLDRFWTEELLRANKDRLFACQISSITTNRTPQSEIKVQGLVTAHAYAILRAVECKGKRFIVLRNPWGKIEWTGRWSDGSKEWTKEWIGVLDELGHSFGEDGQFVMEYDDWLECFTDIDRTLLFDSSWRMSSKWLCTPCRRLPAAFSYGDVSFIFKLPSAAPTVISLAQLNTRYFRDLASRSLWTLDFVVVKEGEDEPLMEYQHNKFQARDVSVEAYLEAGTYIVYARIDRVIDSTVLVDLSIEDWQLPKLSRIMTKRAEGRLIASNITPE